MDLIFQIQKHLNIYDKLKIDSKIPFSRFERDSNGGQVYISADGLDREEVRFSKFINRLRSIFQEIILKPLWLQLALDFPELKDDELIQANLGIQYIKDNVFEQIREQEVMEKKMQFIMTLKDYTENDQSTAYFDSEWLISRYLGMTKDDLEQNKQWKAKQNKENKDDEEGDAKTAVDSFGV